MESTVEITKITKCRSDCPVFQVTVYQDRAEVCRRTVVDLEDGTHEINITDFVEIEEDSIRVEGKGNATIAEVSFKTESVHKDEIPQEEGKEKELQEELKRLEKEREDLQINDKLSLRQDERRLLDKFFNKAASSGVAPNMEQSPNVILNAEYLSSVKNYMEEYRDMTTPLQLEIIELKKKDEEMQKAINVVKKKIDDLNGRIHRKDFKTKRTCIVVVESPKATQVQLTISYLVLRASWIPSYDLRMITEQEKLKVYFYGLISQSSGEDWKDAKIFLSTAQPSIGGTIPSIPISYLSIQTGHQYAERKRAPRAMMNYAMAPRMRSSRIDDDILAQEMDCSLSEMDEMDVIEVKVVDKATTTSYEIARMTTIPSDNSPHKVTVAIIDTTPELLYVTIPKASPKAFLRAKVVNSSPFMLLAGNSCIYLDNTFVCKANFAGAAPREEFNCSLGVDPSVRVVYKPVEKKKSRSGLVNKTDTTRYTQMIQVKNIHDKPIKILVQDSLPKSTTDKIKVNLICPEIDLKNPEKQKEVRLTRDNAVEWDLTIASMKTRELELKYSVEHSANDNIDSNDSIIVKSSS